MPPINFLIKPASGNCNIRCKYCFYHNRTKDGEYPFHRLMDEETLKTIVKKGLKYGDGFCGFAFQGGEPTLVGLEFYQNLIRLQNQYNKKGITIYNTLQTNGLLIDEEWAGFLHDNNFLVGLSLDGPRNIHDLHRRDITTEGTFRKVMNTVELFKKYNVEFNILYVVTASSARHADKIYSFFKKNGLKYIQFIPCLDSINESRGKHSYSLKPEGFERFLKVTFDRWYKDFLDGNYVSIRYFDNIIGMLMGHIPESCSMRGNCQCQFVVESDGGVYPCDFYVLKKWELGNIKENSIEDIINCNTMERFIRDSLLISDECKNCKWFGLCRGGCRRDRENFEKGKISLNYYCRSYKSFYEYAYPRLLNVASIVKEKLL